MPIDTTPLPENSPLCSLADFATSRMTAGEAIAAGMAIAAAEGLGIDPRFANVIDCRIIAAQMTVMAGTLTSGKPISPAKVSALFARVRFPARDAAQDATMLRALFADTFRAGPWNR